MLFFVSPHVVGAFCVCECGGSGGNCNKFPVPLFKFTSQLYVRRIEWHFVQQQPKWKYCILYQNISVDLEYIVAKGFHYCNIHYSGKLVCVNLATALDIAHSDGSNSIFTLLSSILSSAELHSIRFHVIFLCTLLCHVHLACVFSFRIRFFFYVVRENEKNAKQKK